MIALAGARAALSSRRPRIRSPRKRARCSEDASFLKPYHQRRLSPCHTCHMSHVTRHFGFSSTSFGAKPPNNFSARDGSLVI